MKLIRIALILNTNNNLQFASIFSPFDKIITSQFNHPQQFDETIYSPDIIVVDTDIAETSALGIIKMLIEKSPHAKIIAICTQPDVDQARALIKIGVTGIFLSNELTCGFAHVAKTIYMGRIVISPQILKQMIA